MGAAFTPAERRLVGLLVAITVAGTLWHITRDLRPAPPPVEILRGVLLPDTTGASRLHVPGPPPVFPLDVAVADSAALTHLPGIGPVLAGRIVAWRKARGGITDPGELISVSGIGPVVLARIGPLLTVGTPAERTRLDTLVEARGDSLGGPPSGSGEWR
jgi:hypothetical protein